MTLTKDAFIAAYREEIMKEFAWAADPDKLARFMTSVSNTICLGGSRWHHDSTVARRVYKRLGGTKYSLKALRALPDKEIAECGR